MHIEVEDADPTLNDVRPDYWPARGTYTGLRISGVRNLADVFCPWCGTHVPVRQPGRDYAASSARSRTPARCPSMAFPTLRASNCTMQTSRPNGSSSATQSPNSGLLSWHGATV